MKLTLLKVFWVLVTVEIHWQKTVSIVAATCAPAHPAFVGEDLCLHREAELSP